MLTFLESKPVCTLVVLVLLGTVIGVLSNLALDSGRSFVIQDVVRTALLPSQWTIHQVFAVGDQAAQLVKSRSTLLTENARLKREVLRLRRENSLLREAKIENVRLREALQISGSMNLEMQAAEIISRNESSWFDTATLDRGRKAGVERCSAVVSQAGRLVGQVTQVDPFTSEVVALTYSGNSIGGMVRRSRCCGLLRGQGTDELVLEYLPKDADVKPGDVVVSSGRGRVIPKGLPVGNVIRVVRRKAAGTTSALIEPSVRLEEAEQVFIVKPGQTGTE